MFHDEIGVNIGFSRLIMSVMIICEMQMFRNISWTVQSKEGKNCLICVPFLRVPCDLSWLPPMGCL